MRQKIAELINVIFGFRKMVVLIMLYIVGVVFRIQNLINGAEMVDLFKTTTIAFIGANSVEHIVGAVNTYTASKSAPDDPRTAYDDLVSPSAQEAEDAKAEGEKNG